MDSSLTETLRDFARATGAAINSIKINSVTREIRDGRPMWLKRRKPGSELVAISANLFFRLTGARIRVRVNSEEWQRWEISCFRLLHGRGFRAFAEGLRTVCADKVPGRSLVEYLNQGSFTPRMLEAAARELRRAHQLWSGEFDNLWSHGDPHLGNVIYDKAADRARLIDFEAPHAKSLPAVARQADDLLVFLQDMGGRVSAEQWLPFALDFLNTYDRPEVVTELRKNLIIPGGLPGLWWKLRSHYLPRTELFSRFAALERALARKWHDGGCHAPPNEALPKSASPDPVINRNLITDWRRRALGLLPGSLAKKGLNLRMVTPSVREAIEGRLSIGVDRPIARQLGIQPQQILVRQSQAKTSSSRLEMGRVFWTAS